MDANQPQVASGAVNLDELHAKLLQIDVNSVNLEIFTELVGIIDGHLQKNQTPETSEKVRAIFKLSEKTLVDFSKCPAAWDIVYAALQAPGLSDHHYFHAANILKNKLKIDFVAIRGDLGRDASWQDEETKQKVLLIRRNLLMIIKNFA